MSTLDYLEVKIVNHCNYKCRACYACANIASRDEYGLIEYENDIRRVSKLFNKINVFRLLGGEPLLSNDICKYLQITKKYLPNTDIHLVTNGSLLKSMDQSFYDLAREHLIKVDVTNYVNKGDNIKQIVLDGINRLKENEILLEINDNKYFGLSLDVNKPNNSINEVFANCRRRTKCNNLYHGKIYPCIQSLSFEQYDEYFDTSIIKVQDGIDIYENNITGKDILIRLEKPIHFCINCTLNPIVFHWEEGVAQINDWFSSKENELYNHRISLYDYFTDTKKYKANIINILENGYSKLYEIESNNVDNYKYDADSLYIWVESLNCYYIFDEYLKKVFLHNNIIYRGLINNEFVQRKKWNENIIDYEHITYPCNILFFPFTNKSLINTVRKIKKLVIAKIDPFQNVVRYK